MAYVQKSQSSKSRSFEGLKFSLILFTFLLITGTGTATDLNNIESITPSGSNPISITGNLDMNNNNINNFFGSSCSTGSLAVHINDDGTLDCVDATSEVQSDFVDRSGDSMTGNLDITGTNDVSGTGAPLIVTESGGDSLYLGGNEIDSIDGSLHLQNNNAGSIAARSNIDLYGNSLNNVDWANSDNPNTDSQQLSISGDTISLGNGGSVTISDDQTLSTTADTTGTNDQISIAGGNSIEIDDDFEANTNTQLDDQAATATVDLNGNSIINADWSDADDLNSDGRLVQDSVGIDETADEIADSSNSANLGDTGAWYRIADNGPVADGSKGGDRAAATFIVHDTESGEHSTTIFHANVHYGNQPTLNLVSRSSYSNDGLIERIRLVEGDTYEGAAVEVYVDGEGSAGNVEYRIYNDVQSSGWSPVDWNSGSVPTGFATTEIDLTNNPVMATASNGGNNQFEVKRNGDVNANGFSASERLQLPTGADAY